MGRNEEAVTAYLQCLVLQPNNRGAKEKLAAIYPKVDREGCGMDLQCPSMREHLRAAYNGLAQILRTPTGTMRRRWSRTREIARACCREP